MRESERKRGRDPALVDEVIEIDTKWRQTRHRLDKIKEQKGQIQKAIGKKMKEGKGKADVDEEIGQKKELEEEEKKGIEAEKELLVERG